MGAKVSKGFHDVIAKPAKGQITNPASDGFNDVQNQVNDGINYISSSKLHNR